MVQTKSSKAIFSICAFVSALCLTADLLLLVPAPTYHLWIAAVGVSELSLWLCLVCAFITAYAVNRWRSGARSNMDVSLIVIALVAALIALIPTVQAFIVASELKVPLSMETYFFGHDTDLNAVAVTKDVQYSESAKSPSSMEAPLSLDVYEMPVHALKAPAVIVVHGGSWRNGRKSDFEAYDRWLATQGYVVFDMDYRHADAKTPFPAQLHDVQTAIAWVQKHAKQYSIDPDRLGLLGRSAGAQLAVLAAYTQTVDPSRGNPIKCVVSFYGPMDLTWDYSHTAYPDVIRSKPTLENYLGGPPSDRAQLYADASPAEHVTPSVPPTLFVHGGRDQLVLQQNVNLMLPKLRQAGVPFEFVDLPWANHGFDVSYNGWGGQIARHEVNGFLRKYL